ncbi:peroxiredoxin [Mucilaginibacter arboris]|uniref:Thioredoxin peroxidase n=1 Tax=Mucilaginibacter arboris TaxID=2682090 RepID=A0A7K1T1I2_9SPHI|nr:peroxiredoxin [Mucilaginibacter arboris]MVN23387.1 redoxin domain-containing protein [Mucilaginibacter arboris]
MRNSIVGNKFPNLTVNAMDEMGDAFKINVLQKAIDENKKVLLFWYPKDFTFVCPTEIHAFQAAQEDFNAKNTIVIGASCDSAEVHFAWLSTAKDNGGIEGVTFPLLADTTRKLAAELGILDEEDFVTYRATYLIDEEGTVFHESINHMPLGRNVNEYLRLVDAYTHVQTHGEVCPANWEQGKEAMAATTKGVAEYLQAN